MTVAAPVIAPKGVKVRKGSKPVSKSELRKKLNPRGNTVLRDFGRVLRDEPHKYIYPIKLYMTAHDIRSEPVLEWLRERYIDSKGGVHHGTRYEVRTYKGVDARYVDYILLEKMTDDEMVMFTLQFGQVTSTKVIRDGKLRRPRLKKTEKKELDRIVNDYYLRIEAERRASVSI